jgi:periplasmic protein CpxP/Spy
MTRTKTLDTTRITRWAAASVMVVAGIMASVSAVDAWADSHGKAGSETRADGAGMMHGMHHHGGMHGGMMLGGRGLERMLKDVNATDAQRAQIQKIADSARTDIKALHEGGAKFHDQGLAILTQPTVDAAAAEKLRQQMLAQHDQVSKRMLTTMLDISKVLTPEQRATLATRMKEHQLKREARKEKGHDH